MKKIKMKIAHITPETNPNGIIIYRIKVESDGQTYKFAVKEDDYLVEEKRKRFHAGWIKTIRNSQEAKTQSSAVKGSKQEKMKRLIGKEVEEDE